MARQEVKFGALLSYALIVLNAVYGFLMAPFLLSKVGRSEYDVYQSVASITASISVLELGLGGTLQRYTAKFLAEGERKKCENFSAMGLMQAAVLGLAVMAVGAVLFGFLGSVFNKYTPLQLQRAKQLFVVLILYVACHIFENVLFGIICGYNRFIFTNSMKIATLGLKTVLYLIIMPMVGNALAIVLVSLSLEVFIILAELLYMKLQLHHRIKFSYWDKTLFKESFGYTILLFVQSILIQFNGNIDKVVIGSVLGNVVGAVTVYSFAIQIFNMYEQCATSVSGVLLPTVIKQLHKDDSPEQMEEMTVRYGRVQWMILGAALFGFLCVGKEFFQLWLGAKLDDKTTDAWLLAVILMIPVTFPLIVNVCLAILKAKNLLFFRTIAMLIAFVVNAALTIVGTRIWGYWAAAAGTAISTIIGSVILLNAYYMKKLKLNMFRIYFRIMHRTSLCLLAATGIVLLMNRYIGGTWLYLVTKIAAFIAVYGAMMLLFGMTKPERRALLQWRRKHS